MRRQPRLSIKLWFMTSHANKDQFPSTSNSGDVRRQSSPNRAPCHPTYRGASHAVLLATPAPKAYAGTNGALAAAASAAMGKRVQRVQLVEEATSNGQRREGHFMKTPRQSGASDAIGSSREQSPCYAAALYATSKSPASRQKSLDSTSNSRRPCLNNGIDKPAIISCLTDRTVVGATSSFVNLFESKQDPKRNVPVTHSVRYVTKPTPAIASPTPIKPPLRPSLSTTSSPSTYGLEPGLEKEFTASGSAKTMDTAAAAAAAQPAGRTKSAITRSSISVHSTVLSRTVPGPPAPRRSGDHAPLDAASAQARPARSSTALLTTRSDPASLPLKPSSGPPSRPLLPVRSSRSFETKVDSLANAIVAASLARDVLAYEKICAPTKRPPPSPPPPRRHISHSLFHNHHSQEQMSRTPSPAKAMRQTMREQLPSDDELEYKKRSILMRKHPHKHHEGDRKRYRATMTERERRRYDGVWAANKGLCMDANSADNVLNLVVRDIWSRSRLPDDVLADIYDLVDTQGGDSLKRNEFVVGMWLIDQRLRGRKLPSMVSESLWSSVRLLHGVKVSRHQR